METDEPEMRSEISIFFVVNENELIILPSHNSIYLTKQHEHSLTDDRNSRPSQGGYLIFYFRKLLFVCISLKPFHFHDDWQS